MASKREIIKSLDPSAIYTSSEVRELINKIPDYNDSRLSDKDLGAESVRIGDAILVQTNKVRPAIVISIDRENDKVLVLTMTTQEHGLYTMMPAQSRFFPKSFITVNSLILPYDYACKRVMGVYDNARHIVAIRSKFKEIMNNFIN